MFPCWVSPRTAIKWCCCLFTKFCTYKNYRKLVISDFPGWNASKGVESRAKWEQDRALRPILNGYIEPCRILINKAVWLSGSDCFVAHWGFGFWLGLLVDRIGFRYPTDANADCGFGLAHRGQFNLQMPVHRLTDWSTDGGLDYVIPSKYYTVLILVPSVHRPHVFETFPRPDGPWKHNEWPSKS